MIYGPTLINYNLFDDVKELDNDIQRSCDPEIRKKILIHKEDLNYMILRLFIYH